MVTWCKLGVCGVRDMSLQEKYGYPKLPRLEKLGTKVTLNLV